MRNAIWTIILTVAACSAWTGIPPRAATVTVNWTAPGDDGNVGTAAVYDIRYATDSATIIGWTGALQVSNEPAPRVAGTAESHTFTIGNGRWFIAIKAADEASNWSAISNIAVVTVDGIAPAAIVDLTAVLGGP